MMWKEGQAGGGDKKKNEEERKPVSLLPLHALDPMTDCQPASDFSRLPACILCFFVIVQWQETKIPIWQWAHQFIFQVIYRYFQTFYRVIRRDKVSVLYLKQERPSRTQHPHLRYLHTLEFANWNQTAVQKGRFPLHRYLLFRQHETCSYHHDI